MEIKSKTHLKAGESEYFTSKDSVKKLAFSWLVAMTMAAERVAPKAKSLNTMLQSLVGLVMAKKTKENQVVIEKRKMKLIT